MSDLMQADWTVCIKLLLSPSELAQQVMQNLPHFLAGEDMIVYQTIPLNMK